MLGVGLHSDHFGPCSRFSSENALVRQFVRSRAFYDQNRSYNLLSEPICEFDCAHGIADVIYFSLRQNWESYRGIGSVPPSWAYALRALPYRKKFGEIGFAEWCGVSKPTARKILSLYQELEFIRPATTRNEWIKIKQPKPLVSLIHAFEAKLRDWKRALYQAIRYKSFAHYSWVLMDAAFIEPALANLERFEDKEIGLASVSSNGSFDIHLAASKRKPKSDIYYWEANALIGSQLMTH